MSGSRWHVVSGLILALAVVPGTDAEAQIPERSALPRVQQPLPPLEVAARTFARFWGRGEVGALGDLMVERGIRFHVENQEHAALPSRNAVATLRELVERHRSLGISVRRVSESPGTPPRGFAELSWEAVAEGTSEPLQYDVYLGFVLEAGSWLVTEVRVLR